MFHRALAQIKTLRNEAKLKLKDESDRQSLRHVSFPAGLDSVRLGLLQPTDNCILEYAVFMASTSSFIASRCMSQEVA